MKLDEATKTELHDMLHGFADRMMEQLVPAYESLLDSIPPGMDTKSVIKTANTAMANGLNSSLELMTNELKKEYSNVR